MTIDKISAAKPAINVRNIAFRESEEEQVIQQKTPDKTKDVITLLSVFAAIGASGVAIYKHKNAKEAIEKAKKEAEKKVEEAEEKAKKAIEDAKKKVNEEAENLKKTIEDTKKKVNETAENSKKEQNTKLDTTSAQTEPVNTKSKKNDKIKNTSVVNYRTSSERFVNKKENKKIIEGKKQENELNEVDEQFLENLTEDENGIIHIPKSTKISDFVQTVLRKIKNLFKRKSATTEPKVEQPVQEIQKKQPIQEVQEKQPIEQKSVSTIEDKNAVVQQKKEEIVIPKPAEAEENAKILEGNIKDNELTVVDDNYLNSLSESESGIIHVPVSTKISNSVQTVLRKIKNLFKRKSATTETKVEQPVQEIQKKQPIQEVQKKQPTEQKSVNTIEDKNTVVQQQKEKTAWQKQLEADKIRYQALVDKAKALNKKAEEQAAIANKRQTTIQIEQPTEQSKKAVLEKEQQLNGRISVTIPKKPTNYEHKQLQKEYDKLAILPEKRVNKSWFELKEQIANIWKQKAKSAVAEKEQQLNGRISVTIPKKPTNYEHKQLQKEYDKLAILPAEADSKVKQSVQRTPEKLPVNEAQKNQLAEQESVKTAENKNAVTQEQKEEIFIPKPATVSRNVKENVKILEGNIKDNELTVVDENYLNNLREGENGIIFIPKSTKIANFFKNVFNNIFKREKVEIEIPVNASEKYFGEGANKGVEYLEKEAILEKNAKTVSDIRNNQWLNQQHEKKEQEYNRIFAKLDKNGAVTTSVQSHTEQSKIAVAEKEQQLNGRISVTIPKKPTNYEHKQLQKEYDKMAILPEKRVNKSWFELKEQIANIWKQKAKSAVAEKERQLNGRISVTIPKKPTNYEHKQLQKEYDELAILPEKRVNKSWLELKEQIANIWKQKAKSAVAEKEQQLNGRISVTIPKKPTNNEHKQLQKEYDKLAILPEKRVNKSWLELKEQIANMWKQKAKSAVAEKEQQLNGKISVTIPKKPTNYEHKQLQNEYDKLAILPESRETLNSVAAESEQIEQKALETPNKVVEEINIQENLSQANNNKMKKVNELPESFNEGERMMAKYVYKHTNKPKDNVTKYPKLYATKEDRKAATMMMLKYIRKYLWYDLTVLKRRATGNFWKDMYIPGISPIKRFKEYFKVLGEEKAAKKEYQKAKESHIKRRIGKYREHNSVYDKKTAIHNRITITKDMKFHSKRYKSMETERPNAKDWEPEMTREEFMKDKYKYIQEAYEKERKY